MPIVECRVLPRSQTRCALIATLLACLVLPGCASTRKHDVAPESPELPPAVVERRPQTAAVYFSAAFRTARPEHSVSFLGGVQTWRHDLGAASMETFRQALAAVYSNVIELTDAPDADSMPPGVSMVVVPEPPAVSGVLDANAVVTTYRQTVEFQVTWHAADTASPRRTAVGGSVATGAHGVGFLSQKTLDERLLRSAGAALVALLSQSPVDDTAASATRCDTAAPPRASGIGILRLDAGLAHDDGLERRIGACIAHAVTPAATVAGARPGEALRDALFPWLDPGVAPDDAAGVARLLERPAVRARLATLGVGKLVLFTARDVEAREKQNLYCAAGYNAGACFGLYESRTGYAVDVTVWDVARREPLATDRTNVERRLGAVGILIPIPFFSSNEAEACEQMRRYVRRALHE
jgi:hypothetical protein